MLRLLARALLLASAAAGPVGAATARPERPAIAAEVTVERESHGWTADYRLGRDAPAWAFLRSALRDADRQPWRPASWSIETSGVHFERHGRYDLLVADRGTVPRHVRIGFRPIQADVEADYSPALLFTDGAVALYSEQFNLTPLASAAAARTLPADPDAVPLEAGKTKVTFRDAGGPVLLHGVRQPEATTIEGDSYILFGAARVVQSPDISTVIDPALPAWLADELAASTAKLLARYARLLGPRAGSKPMLMASWAGPTPERLSMNGGVLPDLVIMVFEGEGITRRDKQVSAFATWFVAHEAAHFWIGNTVRADSADHAWIAEGAADLLTVRAIAELDPAYDARAKLEEAIGNCTRFAANGPIDGANARGEQDAYYACGTVFGLVAEAAADRAHPGTGFAGFWRELIEENRADGTVTEREWLDALTRLSGEPELAAGIDRRARTGVTDPQAEIARLFERAGIAANPTGVAQPNQD